MVINPVNSSSWRARYIKYGGTEKGLRELYLMYERTFNKVECIGVKWDDWYDLFFRYWFKQGKFELWRILDIFYALTKILRLIANLPCLKRFNAHTITLNTFYPLFLLPIVINSFNNMLHVIMAQAYIPDEYARIIFNHTKGTLALFMKVLCEEKFKKEGWKKWI